MPALVVVLGAGLWGLGVASLQAGCATAARSAALAAARGEADAAIVAHVRASLGPSASVVLSRSGPRVSARVTAQRTGVGLLPAWPVTWTATAMLEPSGPPGSGSDGIGGTAGLGGVNGLGGVGGVVGPVAGLRAAGGG